MTGFQFADHLHQQRVQIFAPTHMLQQRLVLGVNRIPVQTVQVAGVEILLLHAPGFGKDLRPLLARVDEHAHGAQIKRLEIQFLGNLAGSQLAAGLLQQNLFAVGADAKIGHVARGDVAVELVEIKPSQHTGVWLGVRRRHAGTGLCILDIEQHAVFRHLQRAVIAGSHRQPHHALA